MSTILIAGDYSPKDRISKLIETGKTEKIFADIKLILSEAEYTIVNFESTVTSSHSKLIKKAGPGMHCTSEAITLLRESGFKAVTLANNHFRDYGDEGVNNSINEFEKNGIDYFGGGRNISEAEKIFYKDINGKIIAFINICEHEFSIATETSCGSAPLDIIDVSRHIMDAKDNADYILVIIHGGNEHYQLPSPRMQKTYRFFIEQGADVVVNHHQHCYSGYELYQGKPIFYGLGNFCFDWNGRRNSIWNEGYMIKLNLDNNIQFEMIPYIQCDVIPSVVLMDGIRYDCFIKRIEELNKIILDKSLLNKMYDEFCQKRKRSIIAPFTAYLSSYARIAAGHHWIPYLIPEKKMAGQINFIECESHRDVLLKILHEELDK